jgi:serine/threonine-protein kinase
LTTLLPVIQFIHQEGMIHRDIKPSNIIRARNGRYYLIDFGAVTEVVQHLEQEEVSEGGTRIFSAGFRALVKNKMN